jgi:hypothetical protein
MSLSEIRDKRSPCLRKVNMKEISENPSKNFTAFSIYEATYRTEQGEDTILLEFRTMPNEQQVLFTVIDNKQIRADSIHELVYSLPSLVSLGIPHSVRLLWNGNIKLAKLIETFRPSQDIEYPSFASLQLRLVVDNKTYETALCNTLQDAIWELQEMTEAEAAWWLRTCYHCQYSGQARDYALSDREFWCYRDVPDAFAEIQAKGKYASREARQAGRYFVNAFHACAAWRLLATGSSAEERS